VVDVPPYVKPEERARRSIDARLTAAGWIVQDIRELARAMEGSAYHLARQKSGRLKRLNQIAIRQMQTLTAAPALRQIEPPKERKP
jgi:hypothetical protein